MSPDEKIAALEDHVERLEQRVATLEKIILESVAGADDEPQEDPVAAAFKRHKARATKALGG